MATWFAVTLAVVLAGAHLLGRPSWEVAQGNTWPAAAMFFLTFLGLHLGLAIVLPLLHRRGYTSLFGPGHRLDLRPSRATARGVALAVAAALYALMAVEHLVLPAGWFRAIHPAAAGAGDGSSASLPALALIFLQASAEEAVFRGYLLQQLRARFRSPLVWAVLPALLFGAAAFRPGHLRRRQRQRLCRQCGHDGHSGRLRDHAHRQSRRRHRAAFRQQRRAHAVRPRRPAFRLLALRRRRWTRPRATPPIRSSPRPSSSLAIFVVWWRWMNRHRPIANPPRPA